MDNYKMALIRKSEIHKDTANCHSMKFSESTFKRLKEASNSPKTGYKIIGEPSNFLIVGIRDRFELLLVFYLAFVPLIILGFYLAFFISSMLMSLLIIAVIMFGPPSYRITVNTIEKIITFEPRYLLSGIVRPEFSAHLEEIECFSLEKKEYRVPRSPNVIFHSVIINYKKNKKEILYIVKKRVDENIFTDYLNEIIKAAHNTPFATSG